MTSEAGIALTEAHRLAQNRLAVETTARAAFFWPLLDPERVDATRAAWVASMLSPMEELRGRSVQLAHTYQQSFQQLELGTLDGYPDVRVETERTALRVSLDVTGPVAVKQGMATSTSLQRAMDKAFVRAVGAATRYVLNGGREYIAQSILRNPRAQGYVRVTDGRPCAFCAMLASRGPVYKGDSFDVSDARFAGGGTAKVHDHDGCQIMSVYTRDEPMQERAAEWDRLWQENPTIEEFRAAYNALA